MMLKVRRTFDAWMNHGAVVIIRGTSGGLPLHACSWMECACRGRRPRRPALYRRHFGYAAGRPEAVPYIRPLGSYTHRRICTKGLYVLCMRHFPIFSPVKKTILRAKYVQIEKFFMERAFCDCIFVLSCCILVLIKNDCLPALQYDSFFSSRMAYCRAGNDKINSKEQRTCLLK